MSRDLPDWLKDGPLLEPGRSPGSHLRDRHLSVLRQLLAADHLRRADWRQALTEVARMAQQGLGASAAMVAIYDAASQRWSAHTSGGEVLANDRVSTRGSTAVLDEVRRTGKPLLTSGGQALAVHSMSVADQGIESVLAVPLHWWESHDGSTGPILGGCLYAHRTADEPAFGQADVDLVIDIARLVEPTLNVLRQMTALDEELRAQREALDELRASTARSFRLGSLETQDARFGAQVLEPLRRVASADRIGLLILGPSGAGKSFLARAYHLESRRKRGPFVTLDCAQITSETTLGAELFGYAANSGYANAPPRGRPGKAKLADGGSLFLDEVGSLPNDLQQKLLRLIQEGTFAPLGGSEEEQVDLQIIAATNEPLEDQVARGAFREDLYWRLCEMVVELPALDQRMADIPALAVRFMEVARTRFGKPRLKAFTAAAMDRLVRHPWSRAGNIRGLEHAVTRAVLLAPAGANRIAPGDLQLEAIGAPRGPRPALGPTPAVAPAPARAAIPEGPVWSRRRSKALEPILAAKIREHLADVTAMARDPALCQQLGYGSEAIPVSTLYAWIRDLELRPLLRASRHTRRDGAIDGVVAAIRQHGSGSAAGRALGISRDALLWQLRKAGLTIAGVLALTE